MALLMTLPDAARDLGIAPSTLRLQVKLGKLEARKVGPRWYVDTAEVERYRRVNRRAA
jgi:hypothetical protein